MKILPAVVFCLSVATLVEAEESAGNKPAEVVLFDGKSLKDWEAVDIGGSGQVDLEGGCMIINQGDSLSGVVYKKAAELPVTNYEIALEAKRLQGVDFFCALTFPVGKLTTCATLILGGWGGSVTGISNIDGYDASNNFTGTYQRYEDDKWYPVRLRVTAHNISAWVGEKQVVDADIKDKKVSLRPGPIEAYVPLSLTTYNTTGAIRKVKFKRIEAP